MHGLLVRHRITDDDTTCFQVVRGRDNKSAEPPVSLSSPALIQLTAGLTLREELRWYLERFLDYPFSPQTERAERTQAALRQWGEEAFTALFGAGTARDFYSRAADDGLERLTLQIVSDDPAVLAWPWEALRDPQVGSPLAHACQVERRLDTVRDPMALPEDLPKDRLHILLITARPYEGDVAYRSLSRPLVELAASEALPVQVTVLRPPTFDTLRAHLRDHPGEYHLVHFDGHGAYGAPGPAGGDNIRFRGLHGCLVFENEAGKEQAVTAEQLSALLREHRIPVMVLNACQSAMVDEQAEDAFASVATALVQAGIRSVVAMAYSLYVSGAEVFLPAFYQRLFESGSVAEATRAGRQAMLEHPERVCARGRYPLDDWLVPVLYQQEAPELAFTGTGAPAVPVPAPVLPEEFQDAENPYGFIGRDGAVLALERALRRPPASILIHGLGGVGKTTLARGLVQWLAATGGLGEGAFWFTFNDIRSAEYVLNRLVGELFGANALAAPSEQKLTALVEALTAHPFVIVFDNFESVSGIPDTAVEPLMPATDRERLAALVRGLRGGCTKVLITSRSEEPWLAPEHCFRLPLGGLKGEERWAYCATIVQDLGLTIDQADPELVALMELLDGHPLAMRAVLPSLAKHSAAALSERLKRGLTAFAGEDAAQQKLFTTLRFVEQSLPTALASLRLPLGLHERFVDADYLEHMAKAAEPTRTRAEIDRFLGALATAGLVFPRGQGLYGLHPVLTGYLRAQGGEPDREARTAWSRAFVDVMGSVANALAPKPLHEQRGPFHYHGANFDTALLEAERLGMDIDFAALTQSLAAFAQNQRDFPGAARRFETLAAHHRDQGHQEGEAAAYHQLGRIAEEQRDFKTAEAWYQKSLAIEEKLGHEHGAAITYHQLGIIAQAQRDFDTAEAWYQKSLAIEEKLGDEHGAASTYHQLGSIAQAQRDFNTAEAWYHKALAMTEKLGDEHGAASTYHQLGRIAQEQRDFDTAEAWYQKSLAIKEKLGNEHGAASTYHQLGSIAEEQRDFHTAEAWYHKALAIEEKLGNEHGAAGTYHQLGIIAQAQRDFNTAEAWYQKSLAIEEKLGNEHGAASTYCQLGLLAGEHDQPVAGGQWLVKGLAAFARANDERMANQAARAFLQLYEQATADDQVTLAALWQEAGLGPFPSRGG